MDGSGARMALSEHDLIEALRGVEDPELHMSIVDLGMLREVRNRRGRVTVSVALTVAGCPMKDELGSRVRTALGSLAGVKEVKLELGVMTPAELDAVRSRVAAAGRRSPAPAAWASANAEAGRGPRHHDEGHDDEGHDHGGHDHAGHAPGEQAPRAAPIGHEQGRPNPFGKTSRTRVVGISSGKGGVGKSSVTVNLAVTLAAMGHDVAVLDADVYGFSVPGMLGVDSEPTVDDLKMLPPVAHGVRCMSMGFFVDDSQPVIWRGPMLHKVLEQFLVDVAWGDPEFLLIDMPPGTGDVALSMAQYLPTSEVYVVTTPQSAAQRVAQRTAYMARKVNLPTRGVIENMSWFVGPDGTLTHLFGEGGGAALAEELGVPLLGQIPFDQTLREGGDSGVPVCVSHPQSAVAAAFSDLADSLVARGKARVFRSELTLR
jgi:ATP-binding protein involved in chromosome partitioning